MFIWRGRGMWAASDLQPVPLSAEIAQAVSVAAAYFEDTLAVAPTEVLSAGSLGAERLARILKTSGVGEEDGLRVRELVERGGVAAGGGDCVGAAGVVVGRGGGAAGLMRITVNLATRPFIELRPFFLRLRILMGVLAVVALGALVALAHPAEEAGCSQGADRRGACAGGGRAGGEAQQRAADARAGECGGAGSRALSECAVFAQEFFVDGGDDGPGDGAAGGRAGDVD